MTGALQEFRLVQADFQRCKTANHDLSNDNAALMARQTELSKQVETLKRMLEQKTQEWESDGRNNGARIVFKAWSWYELILTYTKVSPS